jgi:hypothetical protein
VVERPETYLTDLIPPLDIARKVPMAETDHLMLAKEDDVTLFVKNSRENVTCP